MAHLLLVTGRVANGKHAIPNRARAEMVQDHMRGDGKHARIVRERCSVRAQCRSRTPDERAHGRMRGRGVRVSVTRSGHVRSTRRRHRDMGRCRCGVLILLGL